MNRFEVLVDTGEVAVRRFDHVPGVAHRDPERERAARHGVNFVEAGAFHVRTTGAWHAIGPGTLFVTTPGMEFSCAHEEDHPSDACLSVTYSDASVDSAKSAIVMSAAPARPLTNRLAFLQRELRLPAAGDHARTEALGGALLWSLAAGVSRQPLFRLDRLAWYSARVERAKVMMESRYADPLSLSEMARDAGMSLFHFARIFAELEGRPPHRYLTEVRLARAHAQLRDGASVTDACFAVGFGSLSHFTTTFRRRYGRRPSEIGNR